MTIDGLPSLVTSPHLIDLILVFIVLEALVVLFGRGMGPAAIGRMLLPGVCLLVAVRAALAGVAWPWVPAALAAALIAHLWDLQGRWKS